MKSLVCLVSLCGALAGCYETPGNPDREGIIRLERTSSETLIADGHDVVDFRVAIHFLTPATSVVTIQTSDGTLAPETSPAAENAKKIERKNPGDGIVPFSLRLGNRSGETIVSAHIGEFEDNLTLNLAPSEATTIELNAESTQITADGVAKIDVKVLLYAADAEQSVSLGQRVEFLACCVGPNDTPTACDTSTLVSFPKLVALEQGQEIPVQIVPRKLSGTDSLQIWLLAQSQKQGQPPPSCGPTDEKLMQKRLLLTFNPSG